MSNPNYYFTPFTELPLYHNIRKHGKEEEATRNTSTNDATYSWSRPRVAGREMTPFFRFAKFSPLEWEDRFNL